MHEPLLFLMFAPFARLCTAVLRHPLIVFLEMVHIFVRPSLIAQSEVNISKEKKEGEEVHPDPKALKGSLS